MEPNGEHKLRTRVRLKAPLISYDTEFGNYW